MDANTKRKGCKNVLFFKLHLLFIRDKMQYLNAMEFFCLAISPCKVFLPKWVFSSRRAYIKHRPAVLHSSASYHKNKWDDANQCLIPIDIHQSWLRANPACWKQLSKTSGRFRRAANRLSNFLRIFCFKVKTAFLTARLIFAWQNSSGLISGQ